MMSIEELTAQDRCDGCGAQAVVTVQLGEGKQPLLFCSHHANKHRAALTQQAATIWDMRGMVVFDRSVVHIK